MKAHVSTIAAAATAAVFAFAASSAAQAQAYPNKPITMIVASTAGGSADFGARIYAEIVGRSMGQRIVVENRQGGGG